MGQEQEFSRSAPNPVLRALCQSAGDVAKEILGFSFHLWVILRDISSCSKHSLMDYISTVLLYLRPSPMAAADKTVLWDCFAPRFPLWLGSSCLHVVIQCNLKCLSVFPCTRNSFWNSSVLQQQ